MMDIMVSLIKFILIGGLVPYLLGVKLTQKVEGNDARPLMRILNGYIIMWAMMQLLSIPMIFLHQSFHLFVWICLGGFSCISLWNLITGRKSITDDWKNFFPHIKTDGLMRTILHIMFFLQATYVAMSFLSNDDDAFYVATAQTSLDTDTMFSIDPYTGDTFTAVPSRYVLSPFPLFVAFMSRVVGVKAPTMAHTLLPFVLLLMVYVVYALWSRILLPESQKAQTVFLFFAALILAFSDFSTHARGMMMFPRIWQGKGVLATILLPLVLLLGMRIITWKQQWVDWIYLLIVMISTCFVSSMGIILAAIEIGICGVIAVISNKRMRQLALVVLCCLPNLIYALLYVLLR